MRRARGLRRLAVAAVMAAAATLSSGCAMVKMKAVDARTTIAEKRGDIVTANRLSDASKQALSLVGSGEKACLADVPACVRAVTTSADVPGDSGLAAASEIWVAHADQLDRSAPRSAGRSDSDAEFAAWMEAARYAYVYLFFGDRTPAQRSLEDRQTQVRDYYNSALEHIATATFQRTRAAGRTHIDDRALPAPAPWALRLDRTTLENDANAPLPEAMHPASRLGFTGIRNHYRRDGFGTEMVLELPDSTTTDATAASGDDERVQAGYTSVMATPNVTLVLSFDGDTRDALLTTSSASLHVYDPLISESTRIGAQTVPLAGNFTAGYALWLSRASFATQSLRTLFAMKRGLERPHLFLMQPYDPNRRVVLLVHGIASSPEAWVDVANELLGDDALRRRYQVWIMYYPTNLPIAYNHIAIRRTVEKALDHYDPTRSAPASRNMVLVGHSMGGVISRLMVSSSNGDGLWKRLFADQDSGIADNPALREELEPLLRFEPMPEVGSAVFLAAPHRGTPTARGLVATLARKLTAVPAAIATRYANTAKIATDLPDRLPLSIDNLSDQDPFIQAAAALPIRPGLPYDSIMGVHNPRLPTADSSDGVVPYASAHLDGARSETLVMGAGHSVQTTTEAILTLRRILREER